METPTTNPRVAKSRRVRIPGAQIAKIPVLSSGSGTVPKDAAVEVTVEFKLRLPEAKAVAVAGTFNNWDPERTPLKHEESGWNAAMVLPRGQYEYKFVVDGRWVADPGAKESVPNPFGDFNSVLSV